MEDRCLDKVKLLERRIMDVGLMANRLRELMNDIEISGQTEEFICDFCELKGVVSVMQLSGGVALIKMHEMQQSYKEAE